MAAAEDHLRLEDMLRRPEQPRPKWLGLFDHLSYSAVSMLHRCPEQFRRRYVLGERERPNEAGIIGSTFHSTLEWNYRDKIASHEDKPLPELVDYLNDEAWPTTIEKRGGPDEVFWEAKDRDEPRQTAERVMTAYRRDVTQRIQPIAVEQKTEIELPGVLPVPLLGYIDTETEHLIIDTKTGRQAVKKPKPQWVLQGGVYQLLRPKSVQIHTISRAKMPQVWTPLEDPRLLLTYMPERTVETMRTLHNLAGQIEDYMNRYGPDETWPTLGTLHDWACNYCSWRDRCPAWEWERKL